MSKSSHIAGNLQANWHHQDSDGCVNKSQGDESQSSTLWQPYSRTREKPSLSRWDRQYWSLWFHFLLTHPGINLRIIWQKVAELLSKKSASGRRITETQNIQSWKGRTRIIESSPVPAENHTMCLRTLSKLFLSSARLSVLTTSPGSLFQCPVTLIS